MLVDTTRQGSKLFAKYLYGTAPNNDSVTAKIGLTSSVSPLRTCGSSLENERSFVRA